MCHELTSGITDNLFLKPTPYFNVDYDVVLAMTFKTKLGATSSQLIVPNIYEMAEEGMGQKCVIVPFDRTTGYV